MRFSFAALAAVLLLAACGDSPADPPVVDKLPTETSYTFSYRFGEGAWQSFAARGQQPPGTQLIARGPWVFTAGTEPYYGLYTVPYQAAGSGWMGLIINMPLQARSDSILVGSNAAMTCPGPSSRPCVEAVMYIESAPTVVLETCRIVNGELLFTRRTPQWVSGRLHGTGTCTAANGAQRAFAIKDGMFDIALPPPAHGPPG